MGSQILLGIQAKRKYYHDLNLGLMIKTRGLKRCGPRMQLGNHIHIFGSMGKCEEMSPHIPEWAPTLGIGVLMDF